MSTPTEGPDNVRRELPLLVWTPKEWAELAADQLPIFLADHAICEQQAAMFGLSLIGNYPDDDELVDKMGALAAEEVSHLRRVTTLMRKRGIKPGKKRKNPWVQGLRKHMQTDRGPWLKTDRLLVGALIEARSCERFQLLADAVPDPELAGFYRGLLASEARHHRIYLELACELAETERVRERLSVLALSEAEILRDEPEFARLHT